MTRKTSSALVTLLLLTALPGCITGGGGGGGTPNIPHLTLQDVDGRPHHLSDYIGQKKLVVMSFWATWCMPCRQELGVLQQLYEAYGDKGLAVLAINGDSPDTVSRVRPFVRQSGWTFTVLLDSETKAASLYNPRKQMPCMRIFDADGRIVFTATSFQPGDADELKRRVRKLLEQQPEPEGEGTGEGEGEG